MKEKNRIINKKFAETDPTFNEACRKAGIEPTTRQASKWRNGKGIALRHKNK